MSFGVNLKVARTAAGLTQTELGANLRSPAATITISHWEQGKMVPSLDRLRDICAVLRCSADALLDLAPMVIAADTRPPPRKVQQAQVIAASVARPVGLVPTLASEERRAIGPKPREKWNLSTCAKSIECPGCGAKKRMPCAGPKSCPCRLWALAAHRRRGVEIDIETVRPLFDIIERCSDKPIFRFSDCSWAAFAGGNKVDVVSISSISHAIECGLLFLMDDSGYPAWLMTSRMVLLSKKAEYAAGWKR
jgi:transcriptional regulator with XRE-family HTH domain